MRNFLPVEQLHLHLTTKIPRDKAVFYRTHPQAFTAHGQLALQAAPPAIVTVDAYLELTGEGTFPTQADVTIEPDQEAIALQAFTQAQQAGTESALASFIQKHPQSSHIPEAQQHLDQLRTDREQQELERTKPLARTANGRIAKRTRTARC